jgi:hypothetical protein
VTRSEAQRPPARLLRLIGLAAVLAVASGAGLSARAAEGVLQAFSYETIPPGASVEVLATDDSDENLKIKHEFETSLVANDHPTSPNGRLIFDFEAQRILQGQRDNPKYLGTFHADGRRGEVMLNIWSNTLHSVLGGTRYSEDFKTVNGYVISVNLRDRSTGTLLWQGEASGDLQGASPLPLAKDMVAALVGSMGQTVRSGSIPAN